MEKGYEPGSSLIESNPNEYNRFKAEQFEEMDKKRQDSPLTKEAQGPKEDREHMIGRLSSEVDQGVAEIIGHFDDPIKGRQAVIKFFRADHYMLTAGYTEQIADFEHRLSTNILTTANENEDPKKYLTELIDRINTYLEIIEAKDNHK